jgi:hypothetical protein
MQAIAAYLIFMLTLVALGLSIIFAGVLSIALYEGTSWIWSHLHSRALARAEFRLSHVKGTRATTIGMDATERL